MVFHNNRNSLHLPLMPYSGAGGYDDCTSTLQSGAPEIIKQSDRSGQPGGAGSNLQWRGNGRDMPTKGMLRRQRPEPRSTPY